MSFFAFVIVLAPGLIWGRRRLLQANVIADGTGLRIFNGLRTYSVPWSEVAGFKKSFMPFLFAVRRNMDDPFRWRESRLRPSAISARS